jgi:peptidoglycan hydrolase-like protein with peptidoglycan-binding domain
MMRPRFSFRTAARTRSWAPLAAAVTLAVAGSLLAAPAYAANPVTPGTYRGLGFDQCAAPSQSAMTTWVKKSPFRAAGIYISGNSRACRTQTNLTATWVKNQLAAGWHLMPITLGPQASCSSRYPRYGASIDPTIIATSTNTYSAARSQGALEARRAVAAARLLGIVTGSTLFYDIEAFSATKASACSQSALWYLSSWTQELHRYHYASGIYSSAASGIKMLDDARVTVGNRYTMPDQVWIADWNGVANTSSSYVRSDGWTPYRRAHQYQGGHNETYGGVTINIDRNYLDFRTPALPGAPAPAPTPKPTPAPTAGGPAYTGKATADPRCTPSTISRTAYVTTNARVATSLIVPLQCLLKQQRVYPYQVTGRWNAQTTAALHTFQRRVGNTARSYASAGDWVSLLVAGNVRTLVKKGAHGPDVMRVQRAMNAALTRHLKVNGIYNKPTKKAIRAYQRKVGVARTGVVGWYTWAALRTGRH